VTVPILDTTRHWICPNCKAEDVTHEARPHSRYHRCLALGGLAAPMVPAGSGARVRAVEREDYIGTEQVLLTNGRPVMAVVTDRPDGSNDTAVFAPTAQVSGSAR
jgi:hypothetical protein